MIVEAALPISKESTSSPMQQAKSQKLFEQAQKYIPGGVNSPVRSFRAVQGTPPFISRGRGSRIWDVDGNEYISSGRGGR